MPIPPLSQEDLLRLAADLGLDLHDAPEDWGDLAAGYLAGFEVIDRLPEPERAAAPERPWRRPGADENRLGAWVVRTSVRERDAGALAGRSVVLKDNVALAGVPLSGGASFLDGFVPDEDATVVRRILDAGGEIVGKAACEYLSASAGSHTSFTGPVRNPHAPDHTTGGSSSGCGALVAAGEVELAIGGDQGGSIRFPASYCGIVGMKPTWGLVPYTGILSIDAHIDHTGPMTASVADNALLLEVIAGPDGVDPRQLHCRPSAYTQALGRGIGGLRVGVLEEGFTHPATDPAVAGAVRGAADALAAAGAKVVDVSVPMHAAFGAVLLPFLLTGGVEAILGGGFATHAGGGVPFGLPEAFARLRGREQELPPNVKVMLLAATHAGRHGARRLYAKALRLREAARAGYDAALRDVDALLMPTTPCTAPPLPGADASLAEQLGAAGAGVGNTAQFDVTGHPALSVPSGRVGPLPVGCMLVGRAFEEETLYRLGQAVEAA